MDRISPSSPHWPPSRRDRRGRNRRKWIGPVEALEGRALLATFLWNNPVDGNFSNPAMWTGPNNSHAVPGAGDDAVTASGNFTISVTASTTVNSFVGGGLSVQAGAFSVTGATNATASNVTNLSVAAGAAFHSGRNTTIGGSGSISGNLDVAAGGTMILAGSANAINLEAGATLTGAGTYDILSSVNIDAPVTAPTSLILDSGNSFGIEGPGTLTVPSGATLDWRSGFMSGVGGATNILSGATFKLDSNSAKTLVDRALNNAGSASMANNGALTIDQVAVFTNAGTFTIQDDQPIGGQGTIVNTGVLTKTSGTPSGLTDLTTAFNNQGGTVILQSGVLQLDNGSTGGILAGNFLSPASGGTLEITGRNYSLNQGVTFTGPGTVHFAVGFLGDASLKLNGNVTIPNLAIDGAVVSGPGSLTVPTALSVDDGTLSIGTLNVLAGAAFNLNGTHTATFDAGTFNNAGLLTTSGSENFSLTNGATFNNSGTFIIRSDTTAGGGNVNLGSNTFFVNTPTGIITKNSPAGTGTTNISNGNFTNSGTIHSRSGQLLLEDTGVNTGTFYEDPNSSIALTRSWTLNRGTTLGGTGVLTIGFGFFGYGKITVNANVSAANFALLGGTLNVSPTFTFSVGTLNWADGQINGTGTVAVQPGGTLSISGSAGKVLSQATLSNAGVATWSGTGPINLDSGAVIFNQMGATFNATNDQAINGGSGGTFNNSGTLNKTSLTGVGTSTFTVALNVLQGGVIGVISGNLATGSLVNLGTINLGVQTALNVSGNFQQPFAGTLNVAVGGVPASNQFGQINVSGQASLNGTLNVSLASNFKPALGQSTPILTFGSAVARFVNVNLPMVGGLPVFTPTQKAAEYDLVAATPPAPTGLALSPGSQSGGASTTRSSTPLFTGSAQAFAGVQIFSVVNNVYTLVAVATARADGTFTATTIKAFAPGTYSLVATSYNALGYGTNGLPFTLTVLA